jgi:hypothetical protein
MSDNFFNLAAVRILRSRRLAAVRRISRATLRKSLSVRHHVATFSLNDFTAARPVPTGLERSDHEHARFGGAEASYFLNLEADAFCWKR